MKVIELKSISKEDGYIYYINKYRATAVLEILSQQVSIPLSFSVEISPFGQKTIQIDPIQQDLNYPVMPIKNSLKAFITTMESKGALP